MAMLAVKVLDNHYNCKKFTIINSGYDTLKFNTMQVDPLIINKFNDFLDNQNNKNDINEHVELLHNILVSYLKL